MKIVIVIKMLVLAVFVSIGAWGKKEDKNNGYKSEIKRAESMLLQKNRTQAITTLLNLLESEKQNKQAQLEIKKILKEINGLFLNEKAQQNFELALNLKKSDPAQALAKLTEAQGWEPDNFKIVAEIAKMKISRRDCKNSISPLEKAQEQNPYDETIAISLTQTYICSSVFEKASQVLSKYIDPKRVTNKWEWLQLEFIIKLKAKQLDQAREIIKELNQLDKNNPQLELYEILYAKTENPKLENWNKNSLGCKNQITGTLRKYQQDPYFCELELLASIIEGGR